MCFSHIYIYIFIYLGAEESESSYLQNPKQTDAPPPNAPGSGSSEALGAALAAGGHQPGRHGALLLRAQLPQPQSNGSSVATAGSVGLLFLLLSFFLRNQIKKKKQFMVCGFTAGSFGGVVFFGKTESTGTGFSAGVFFCKKSKRKTRARGLSWFVSLPLSFSWVCIYIYICNLYLCTR